MMIITSYQWSYYALAQASLNDGDTIKVEYVRGTGGGYLRDIIWASL